MIQLHTSRPRRVLLGLFLAIALGMLAWAGCSDDNPTSPGGGTPTPTTSMSGAFVSGTANGPMSVSISSASLASRLHGGRVSTTVVTATGSIKPIGGGTISLTGSYNTDTDTLGLSGSGYVFTGQADTTGGVDVITGSWTGPGGPGVFGCGEGTASNPVGAYCGSYENDAGTDTGNFDFLAIGDEFSGIVFPSDGSEPSVFEGAISGTGTVRNIDGLGQVGDLELIVTGTLNTTTGAVAGTWETRDVNLIVVDFGTWMGARCQ